MAGGVGRHVGEHHVDRPAEQRLEAVGSVVVGEVADEVGRARDRVHLEEIEADDLAAGLFRVDLLDRDLGPAARRAAEIDDALAGFQQVEAGVEFLERNNFV